MPAHPRIKRTRIHIFPIPSDSYVVMSHCTLGCCSDCIRLHSLLIESREYQAIMLLHQDRPKILRRKQTGSLNPVGQCICIDFSRFLIEIQVDNNWSCINCPLHQFFIPSSQKKNRAKTCRDNAFLNRNRDSDQNHSKNQILNTSLAKEKGLSKNLRGNYFVSISVDSWLKSKWIKIVLHKLSSISAFDSLFSERSQAVTCEDDAALNQMIMPWLCRA